MCIGSNSPVAVVAVVVAVACALRAVAVGREMRLVFPQEAQVVVDGLEVEIRFGLDHPRSFIC